MDNPVPENPTTPIAPSPTPLVENPSMPAPIQEPQVGFPQPLATPPAPSQSVQPTIPPAPASDHTGIVPSPEKPKSKSSALMIVAIVFLLLAIAVLGYFVFQNMQKSKEATEVTPTPTIVATPTPDPTANWKTYTKKTFSVKAPSQLVYPQGEANGEDILGLEEAYPTGKTPELGISINFGYLYGNGIVKCPTNNDCYDHIDKSVKGSESAGSKAVTTQISTTILGQTIKGFRRVIPASESPNILNLIHVWIIYPLSHNGNLFQIEFNAFGKTEAEIDQYLDTLNINMILSTFKFLDETATPSASPTSSPSATLTPGL
jgi:hypothetical protein